MSMTITRQDYINAYKYYRKSLELNIKPLSFDM